MDSFTLTLDTAPPVAPALSLDGGATTSPDATITADPSTGDALTDGYSVLLWGDVNPSADPSIQTTEGASSWLPYGAIAVTLSAGLGAKTLHFKLRDDVHNVTGENTASIEVISAGPVPVITITVDVVPDRISEVPGFSHSTLTFTTDLPVDQWRVTVAPATDATVDESATIGNVHGSIVTGGSIAGGGARTAAIEGGDLDDATPGDGAAIIKVFGHGANGWSE